MNIDEILLKLNGYADIKNESLSGLASITIKLTEDLDNGVISPAEYAELLADLEVVKVITEDAADLRAQEELHKLIDIAITIASTAAKAM